MLKPTNRTYLPRFQKHFLKPRFWGVWGALAVALPFSLLPLKFHRGLARRAARFILTKRKDSKAAVSLKVNLDTAFADKSDSEKMAIAEQCLTTAGTFLMRFPRLSLRSRKYLDKNTEIIGLEHLETLKNQGEKIILLAPHTWSIDVLPVLLASRDLPVAAMVKKQKNPVTDWLMNRQRLQYGGRIHERSDGIKHFLKSVKEGFLGYYLPDQDHGRDSSIFVDFFGNPKATLPGIGKLTKISKGYIVPTFTCFDADSGKFIVHIFPPWEGYPTGDDHVDARAMNAFIEQQVAQHPEQYMWNLQFFKTRQDGRNIYKEYRTQIRQQQS